MNIQRYTFIATILLAFSLCLPIANAKHIIVIYDVSGSMISPRFGGSTEVIDRVNNYLTTLLFEKPPQSLDNRDKHIKESDGAFEDEPLYQIGDILTYATYADRRYDKIKWEPKWVHRDEFQQQLPTKFPGRDSDLTRAEVEVYDRLYRLGDDETYWIFITDGDIDITGQSNPDIADLLKRKTQIEDEYDSSTIFGIIVNDRVRIQVRRIQLISEAMFLAIPAAPNTSWEKIKLRKDDAGQFISEFLIIDTKIHDKTKYKINNVNVEIVDKFNNPIKIVNDDNGFGSLIVPPVSLHWNRPPYKFQISLPANPAIASFDNKLKLEVDYNYSGKEDTYSILTGYEIYSIYVSDLDNPNQQIEKVVLRLSDSAYRVFLVIRSDSTNKTAFHINNIHCRILYEDNRELCEVGISTNPTNLDEQFEIVVPKVKDLKKYGNKLVMDINYRYKETTNSKKIETLIEPRGDSAGALMAILLIVGAITLIVGIVVLFGLIRKWSERQDVPHRIKLQIDGDEAQYFTLNNGTTLSFGQAGDNEFSVDVGSSARLRCYKGQILLCEDLYDEKGRELTSDETLILPRDEGDEVHIHFEFVTDDPISSSGSDQIIDDIYGDNLLPK